MSASGCQESVEKLRPWSGQVPFEVIDPRAEAKNKDLEADLVRLASLNLSPEHEAKVLKAIVSSNVRALP